jgi:hypothetical protein
VCHEKKEMQKMQKGNAKNAKSKLQKQIFEPALGDVFSKD